MTCPIEPVRVPYVVYECDLCGDEFVEHPLFGERVCERCEEAEEHFCGEEDAWRAGDPDGW